MSEISSQTPDSSSLPLPDVGNVHAARFADVVMKGGITSGVIYPSAVCELSRSFVFKSIGGTSAGAIAAALTAAAEYRRRTEKSDEGFRALAGLPEELAKKGYLLKLFRPDKATRGLFELFLSLITAGDAWCKGRAAIGAGLRVRPWAALGLAPGLVVVAVVLWAGAASWLTVAAGVVAGLVVAFVGLLVALAIGLVRELVRMDKNFFGLCSGTAEPAPDEPASLTTWLAAKIDEYAGKEGNDPLTFGDLWSAPVPDQLKDILRAGDTRSIDLRTVTTCLTQGRPYSVPFESTSTFYFSRREFAALFPEKVVNWMVSHADPARKPIKSATGEELLPLPQPKDLPVILAARMSLSFPGLISAIPLWGFDYQIKGETDEDGEGARRDPFPCWFSDGGITSNFPIHFFDAVIPRWPTFGLNLRYFPKDTSIPTIPRDGPRVRLPNRNSDGSVESWSHLTSKPGAPRIGAFVGLIQSAMQSWSDNSFLRLPGYRDRIAEIWLTPEEGGMNLDMPEEIVKRLAGYGTQAGSELRRRFASPHDAETNRMSWDNHRLRRMHGSLAALHEVLSSVSDAVERPVAGDTPARDLLTPETAQAMGLTWGKRIPDEAWDGVEEIAEVGASLDKTDPFSNPPRPTVMLRSRAPR